MSLSASEASRQASFRWPGPSEEKLDRWLTSEDVCALAQLSDRQIQRLVADGKLRAYRVGGVGKWRFRQADVDALMVLDPRSEGTQKQCQNNSPSMD